MQNIKTKKYRAVVYGLLVPLTLNFAALQAGETSAKDAKAMIQAEPVSDQAKSIWEQDYLTGDWAGNRTKLADKGIQFGATYLNEVLGNPAGGFRHAVIDGGRLALSLDVDLQKLAHWNGGTFHASAYYIHGSDLSADNIRNSLTVSNIEAYDTFRLFTLWYQQNFLDDKISLRFGQLAADDEFITSEYGALFINGTFGWPALVSGNLPDGGPGYPFATPGFRLRVQPVEQVYLQAAVFDGDPADGAPKSNDTTGTRIDFNQGVFAMYEAGYLLNQEKEAKGLPGTYKLGSWFHTQSFADQRVTANTHDTNYGVYVVADQMIYREAAPAGQESSDQGLGLFWRAGASPKDRNQFPLYTDGGINYKGLIPHRDADIVGLGVGFAKFSNDLRHQDIDTNEANGTNDPVRNCEMVLETTYLIQLAPWWTLQPDVQYIIHPGGGRATDDAGAVVRNNDALVLGLRTSLTF